MLVVAWFLASTFALSLIAYIRSRHAGDSFRFDTIVMFAFCALVELALTEGNISIAGCLVLAAVCITASTDAASGYVYDLVTYPSLVAVFIASFLAGTFALSLVWAAIALAGCVGVRAASRGRALGLGDVKLLTIIAAGLGSSLGEVVAASCIVGAVVTGADLLRRRVRFGQAIPFAPYIAVGTIIVTSTRGVAP